MSKNDPGSDRLPRGVTALPRARGGRGFRASIRRGRAGEVHLGLYATPWLAAFASNVAAELLGHQRRPVEVPRASQPTAEEVRSIQAAVRRRLGLASESGPPPEVEPSADDLLAFFEVTAVGFWRVQAGTDVSEHPEAVLDAAARRLVEAAGLLFWSRSAGHPDPVEAMARLVARRLDQTFDRAEVTRAVLDDDGDDLHRLARWLVQPTATIGRARGFRGEVRHLYPELFDGAAERPGDARPGWAVVLGLAPPYTLERIRTAYRARSRDAHPDAGGSPAAFVRLREAYDQAISDCDAGSD